MPSVLQNALTYERTCKCLLSKLAKRCNYLMGFEIFKTIFEEKHSTTMFYNLCKGVLFISEILKLKIKQKQTSKSADY